MLPAARGPGQQFSQILLAPRRRRLDNAPMRTRIRTLAATLIFGAATLLAAESSNPFAGNWALTIPGGGAGWLGVTGRDGKLAASILWGGGSVVPTAGARVEGDTLVVTRIHQSKRKDRAGKETTVRQTETITARVSGDHLSLTTERENEAGRKLGKAEFTGKRIPPLPPAPDLAKLRLGDPITLFNGKDLTGWRLIRPEDPNGWSVENGVLINRPVQEEGKPRKHYGNLRTEREFEDFHLTLDVRVPPNGNSGIYLRGIYEVQVADTCGKPLDAHNMGGIYSRICPTAAAEKPANEWQTMDITLADRHVTVILNGKKIIDNQPLLGCTGGALTSDEFRPGPIYFQGDHTAVDYRNVILRPVVK